MLLTGACLVAGAASAQDAQPADSGMDMGTPAAAPEMDMVPAAAKLAADTSASVAVVTSATVTTSTSLDTNLPMGLPADTPMGDGGMGSDGDNEAPPSMGK
jgi:hypothetical protein